MLPSIDMFTASVAFFILSLMHMMEMLLLWRMNATLEGPLLWAISLGTGALAFGVLLAEGAWGEIALVLHHSLLILALFFLLEGIFRYNKRPASRLRLRIFFLTYFGLMAALLASLEMEVLRHLITDFTIVAVLLLGGALPSAKPQGNRPPGPPDSGSGLLPLRQPFPGKGLGHPLGGLCRGGFPEHQCFHHPGRNPLALRLGPGPRPGLYLSHSGTAGPICHPGPADRPVQPPLPGQTGEGFGWGGYLHHPHGGHQRLQGC